MFSSFNIIKIKIALLSILIISSSSIICQSNLGLITANEPFNLLKLDKNYYPIKNNDSDIVVGSRFLNNENDIPNYRKLGIKVITQVTNASIKKQLTDSQSGFRAYNKQVINDITPSDSGMGVSTEILIKASRNNFRISEVPIKILYEGDTSTHNPVSHGTSVLMSTIKFTSIEHPLKFYGLPSVIFFVIGITFTYFSVQYYTEIGRLNTNLVLIAGASLVIAVILIIAAILLYSLVSVVREKNS